MDDIPFECATGSIIGRHHRTAPRNCQDAVYVARAPGLLLAIVADGCGSGPRSEVGAHMGVRLVARSVLSQWNRHGHISWDRVEHDVLGDIHQAARAMGEYEQTVLECFLFTLMVACVTADTVHILASGDGVYAVNGQVTTVGPFAGNQPPYLSYRLLGSGTVGFSLEQELPATSVRSFLIGSDGVSNLVAAASQRVPGTETPVGPLDQFWQDDAVFHNPALLSRRLKLIGRDVTKRSADGAIATHHGLLPDDTTMVVARRPESEG